MTSILRLFNVLSLAFKFLIVHSFQFPNISFDSFQLENNKVDSFQLENNKVDSFQLENNKVESFQLENNKDDSFKFPNNIFYEELPNNNIARIQLQNNSNLSLSGIESYQFSNITDNDQEDRTTLSEGSRIFFEGAFFVLAFLVEKVLNIFEPGPPDAAAAAPKMNWTDYQDFDVAQHYLDDLERNYSSVSTEVIGRTWEDRPMRVVKICRGACGSSGSGQPVKPAIWVQTGIHAREWITQAVGMYLIKELVENDQDHPEVVDHLDWYILPFANPDGYQYSRTQDRSWRKNRRPLDRRPCPQRYYSYGMSMGEGLGVDLNRNYGFMYNTSDSSNDPCSLVYIGTGPFSEPETSAIRDFIMKNKDIIMFNDIHAYSQMIFLPWAHTKKEHPNIEEITRLANIGNAAIKATHGKIYRVGCGPCLIYKVGGDGSDWAAEIPKIRYPFSMEIRGTRPMGRTGFELPRDEIIPTGQEIWAFHEAVASDIISNFNNRKIGL